MKIAYIGQKGIPSIYGGVEKHVEELSTGVARQGHEVFVYVRSHYTPKTLNEFKGVKLIHVPTIPTKNLDAITHTFLSTLHALFADYDIIHYHAIGPSSLSIIPRLLKRKAKVVSTFHCKDYYHQKWSWFAKEYLKFGEFMTCRVPHKTIAVSKNLKNYVERFYKRKVNYIPNGAKVLETGSDEELKQWHLKRKQYAVAVTRLIKHKGIHYLINAFKQLEDKSKIPNGFKLVIIGDGHFTDDYVKYLNTISEGRENIIFTGNKTGKSLAELFSNAYVFIQPSESEGLSIALLEAMKYGVTPLVSDIEENIEAIGNAGYTFKSKNVDDLENKMAYILSRPDEVRQKANEAKKRANSEYEWDLIVKNTIDIYNSLSSDNG